MNYEILIHIPNTIILINPIIPCLIPYLSSNIPPTNGITIFGSVLNAKSRLIYN